MRDTDISCKNLEYGTGNKVVGELDLFLYNYDTNVAYIFEVKSTDNYKTRAKAIKQLDKAANKYIIKRCPYNVKKLYTYYVHGEKGKKNKNFSINYISTYNY